MFYAIKYKSSLDGFVDKDMCARINIPFNTDNKHKLIISVLSEKILLILKSHLEKLHIMHDDAHQIVWEKLNKHRKINLSDSR